MGLFLNLIMGSGLLVLAGDSIGIGVRKADWLILSLGVLEVIAGMYFIVAAIRSAST
jgi:hypothetical protein